MKKIIAISGLMAGIMMGCLLLTGCPPPLPPPPPPPPDPCGAGRQVANPLLSGSPAKSGTVQVKTRLFLAVLDSSTSYKDYQSALQGLCGARHNLGPGDRLVVARIASKFDAKAFILGDWSIGKPDQEIFVDEKNQAKWQKKQNDLDNVWKQAEENIEKIGLLIQEKKGKNKELLTDLHETLIYSVDWINQQPQDEKTLIICSDLEHDTGKPTFDPPSRSLDVSKLNVKLLFVPRKDSAQWERISAIWKQYFSGAASFEMLDSGLSADKMIAPNTVPRKLRHPLQPKN